MKSIFLTISLFLSASLYAVALPPGPRHGGNPNGQNNNEQAEKRKAQEKAYYANADTAEYGVRYRLKYLFNKEKNLTYEEDRMVLVAPGVTLDQSYEGLGESRWRKSHPESNGAGDPTLAYHLTPDFYFYYPESRREVNTYRVITEEFKLRDGECPNHWMMMSDTMTIGDYLCHKATMHQGGRSWTAWYTTDLPHVAAPRNFHGLPGVVLQVSDGTGEVRWDFNGLVNHEENDTLFIKYPDKFTDIPVEKFQKILNLVAFSEPKYIQSAGVANKQPGDLPAKYRPWTGLDACIIDNPIVIEEK